MFSLVDVEQDVIDRDLAFYNPFTSITLLLLLLFK